MKRRVSPQPLLCLRSTRLWIGALLALPDLLAGSTIHVDPAGSDRHDGSAARPFASLSAALAHANTEPIREIVLEEGFYPLEGSVRVRHQRGNGERLEIRAAPGADVIISGGTWLRDGWRSLEAADELHDRLPPDVREHIQVRTLAESEIRDFGELRVHGFNRRRTAPAEVFLGLKRVPVAGWPDILPGENAARAEPGFVEQGHWAYADLDEGRVPIPSEKAEKWARAEGLWAHGYWGTDWADYHLPVTLAESSLEPGGDPQFGIRKNGAIRIYNLPEELDQPGEWFLDRTHRKLYLLPGGPRDLEAVIVSRLDEPLLRVDDGSGITFRGITFAHGRAELIRLGSDATGIHFIDCRFAASGVAGIRVDGSDHRIEHCRFEHIGESALVVRGGDREALEPGYTVVTDSVFRHFGERYYAYSGAADIGGVGHVFAHNRVAHGPHLAIHVNGNLHRIEHNHIHDVCRYTDDAGAIYSGRQFADWGNRITDNLIHDVRTARGERKWVHGIYLDDFASGFVIRRNIFLRIDGYGTNFGGGRHNRVEDNFFAHTRGAHLNDNRGVKWITDEPGSWWNLTERLQQWPYREEPWRSAFPALAQVPTDHEAARPYFVPEGSTFKGNAGAQNKEWAVFKDWSRNATAGVEEHYAAVDHEPAACSGAEELADWQPGLPCPGARLEHAALPSVDSVGPRRGRMPR